LVAATTGQHQGCLEARTSQGFDIRIDSCGKPSAEVVLELVPLQEFLSLVVMIAVAVARFLAGAQLPARSKSHRSSSSSAQSCSVPALTCQQIAMYVEIERI